MIHYSMKKLLFFEKSLAIDFFPLTDTGEDSKLVHRRKCPKVTLFSTFFRTRPSDEYDSAPSRKYSRPLLDVFTCICWWGYPDPRLMNNKNNMRHQSFLNDLKFLLIFGCTVLKKIEIPWSFSPPSADKAKFPTWHRSDWSKFVFFIIWRGSMFLQLPF